MASKAKNVEELFWHVCVRAGKDKCPFPCTSRTIPLRIKRKAGSFQNGHRHQDVLCKGPSWTLQESTNTSKSPNAEITAESRKTALLGEERGGLAPLLRSTYNQTASFGFTFTWPLPASSSLKGQLGCP